MLYPQNNRHRSLQTLDGYWDFQPQHPQDRPDHWQNRLPEPVPLAVPGSWNEQRPELLHFFGPGWYQKDLHIPDQWQGRSIFLRVGAAHYKTSAWLNGQLLGHYEGGSLPSEYDATHAARPGQDNRLTLRVDGSLDPQGLPPASLVDKEQRVGFFDSNPAVTYDFFPFAGIHRSVKIYATATNRIEDVTLTSALTDDGWAEVTCAAAVTDASRADKLTCTIQDQTKTLRPEGQTFTATFRIPNPRIWDIGRGELYHASLELQNADGSGDAYRQTFGIRSVEVNEKGIVLNGRNVFLKGFGKHEDTDAFGRAFNAPMTCRDFQLMKWTGANSFRTSHYPYAEEVYDLADREGILVIGETPFVGMNDRMFTPEIRQKALPMIQRMIDRDKNHPCVIAWSLANEPYVSTDRAEAFFKDMAQTARRADPTRPITYVAHVEVEDNRAFPFYDFVCLNKYYGWYINHGDIEGTLQAMGQCLDEYHRAFSKPIVLSEFGADAVAGLHAWPPQPFSEEFQSEMVRKQYELLRTKDYICGAHVWNFADFKTAHSLCRILHNRKGVFTRDRQPKLVAHTLRQLWNEKQE